MSFVNLGLILANTLILVTGQFLWKIGLKHNPGAFQSVGSIAATMFSPYILTGIVMYGMATVLWLFILSRVDLSIAYPIQSLAYVIAVVGSYLIFSEPLSAVKIGGCLLILSGVTLIAWKG